MKTQPHKFKGPMVIVLGPLAALGKNPNPLPTLSPSVMNLV